MPPFQPANVDGPSGRSAHPLHDRIPSGFAPAYVYPATHLVPTLEIESLLFGMTTMVFLIYAYVNLRPGVRPLTARVRQRLIHLAALSMVYAAFAVHWALSVRYTWESLLQTFSGPHGSYSNSSPALFPMYGPVMAECVTFGMFSILIALAVYNFVHEKLRARSKLVMLAVALLMYTVALAHWAIQLRLVAQKAVTTPLRDLSGALDNPIRSAPLALVSVNILISDAVVLWRMCALCGKHRCIFRVISVSLLVPTVAFVIAGQIREAAVARDRTNTRQGTDTAFSFASNAYGTAVLSLSLTTSLLSTSVIGWKGWCYRREIVKLSSHFRRFSLAEKVMIVLVESGCLHCIIWVLYTIDSQTTVFGPRKSSDFTDGGLYFDRLIVQLTGIYLTFIFGAIAIELSFFEKAFSDSSKISAFVAARLAIQQSASDSCITTANITRALHSSSSRRCEDLGRGGRVGRDVVDLEGVEIGRYHHSEETVEGEADSAREPRYATESKAVSETLRNVHVERRPTAIPSELQLQQDVICRAAPSTAHQDCIEFAPFTGMGEHSQPVPRLPTPDFGVPFKTSAHWEQDLR
ncbi:hypothetical protein PENSPDRAFT_749485 [Peniophora sp. CONT]|nr:hypothetical protein PENSPDRAFT_749485 [Peniophora sp. CONT]